MKASELRNSNVSELKNELVELLRERFKLRMQQATKQLVQTHNLKLVRRKIARLQTILQEKMEQMS